MSRLNGDRGAVGGVEVLPFGMLTFVAVALLIANAWALVDTRMAVTAAAREAARAAAEADHPTTALDDARTRAESTLDAFGRGGDRARLDPIEFDRPFGRCARLSVTVRYRVPAVRIPFIGGFGSLSDVTGTASALVDPFRDDVSGAVLCP